MIPNINVKDPNQTQISKALINQMVIVTLADTLKEKGVLPKGTNHLGLANRIVLANQNSKYLEQSGLYKYNEYLVSAMRKVKALDIQPVVLRIITPLDKTSKVSLDLENGELMGPNNRKRNSVLETPLGNEDIAYTPKLGVKIGVLTVNNDRSINVRTASYENSPLFGANADKVRAMFDYGKLNIEVGNKTAIREYPLSKFYCAPVTQQTAINQDIVPSINGNSSTSFLTRVPVFVGGSSAKANVNLPNQNVSWEGDAPNEETLVLELTLEGVRIVGGATYWKGVNSDAFSSI